jgi:hypothetical protein
MESEPDSGVERFQHPGSSMWSQQSRKRRALRHSFFAVSRTFSVKGPSQWRQFMNACRRLGR